MSASLVGSEMCIRDRGDSPRDRHTAPLRPGAPFASGFGAPGDGVAGPVSYTHLTLPTICSV
eukprot:13439958-Alexandrium_andersonii.AAC.1